MAAKLENYLQLNTKKESMITQWVLKCFSYRKFNLNRFYVYNSCNPRYQFDFKQNQKSQKSFSKKKKMSNFEFFGRMNKHFNQNNNSFP